MRLVIVITSLCLHSAVVQCDEEVTVKEESTLRCYYCGIVDICDLPYDNDDGKQIHCDKSCLKFDGQAKDGKRIVVRNCGFFLAEECISGTSYEDTDTVGTICHCLTDDCNASQCLHVSSLLIINLALLSSLLNQ